MLITFNKICLVLTYNADSPTARRQVLAMMEVVTVSSFFATLGSAAPLVAPERPNKKS